MIRRCRTCPAEQSRRGTEAPTQGRRIPESFLHHSLLVGSPEPAHYFGFTHCGGCLISVQPWVVAGASHQAETTGPDAFTHTCSADGGLEPSAILRLARLCISMPYLVRASRMGRFRRRDVRRAVQCLTEEVRRSGPVSPSRRPFSARPQL